MAASPVHLQEDANRLSNVLAALGIMRGDCVAVVMAERPEALVCERACRQLGAVSVALLPAVADLDGLLQQAAARVAIVDAAAWGALAPLRAGLPRLRHVIGIDGAAAGVRAWTSLLPLASPHYDGVAAAEPARVE